VKTVLRICNYLLEQRAILVFKNFAKIEALLSIACIVCQSVVPGGNQNKTGLRKKFY